MPFHGFVQSPRPLDVQLGRVFDPVGGVARCLQSFVIDMQR